MLLEFRFGTSSLDDRMRRVLNCGKTTTVFLVFLFVCFVFFPLQKREVGSSIFPQCFTSPDLAAM